MPPKNANNMPSPVSSKVTTAVHTQGKKLTNTRTHRRSRSGGSSTSTAAGRNAMYAKNIPPTHTTAESRWSTNALAISIPQRYIRGGQRNRSTGGPATDGRDSLAPRTAAVFRQNTDEHNEITPPGGGGLPPACRVSCERARGGAAARGAGGGAGGGPGERPDA